jgi:lysophospholipase L1-like esterase
MWTRVSSVAAIGLLVVLVGCKAPPQKPLVETPSALPATAETPWYEREIRDFEAADKASPPASGQVLFIGSSSVRMWTTLNEDMNPAPVLNRGFGGSKTGEVLAVFDRIVLPYKPSVIVYYCGDNDLGLDNTDSQAAADGFIAFDQRARSEWPGVNVFYIAIKPSVQRWKNWEAMKRANDIVRVYCEETHGATYLDIATPALTAEGLPDPTTFREDGLHLNAKGYAIWTTVIRGPVVEAWEKTGK